MKSVLALCCAVLGFLMSQLADAQEEVIFRQDFESDTVGLLPSGRWYVGAGTGAYCVVSDEATDVPGSPPGSHNLKFAKAQTGGGSQLTVQWAFDQHAEKIMSAGRLSAAYWVYFASGQLMRHVAFRGAGPYKHYMKMVVRGNWPDDIRLEFPINGSQKLLSGAAWHKLTFIMEWEPVWPLPAGGISKSSVKCRFFVDDEEHPGSPANILEDLVSPFGSIELNTADWATAVCYLDDITVTTALPRPEVKSLGLSQGRIAIKWADPLAQVEVPSLYEAIDPGGPWSLLQGNIESVCLILPGEEDRRFYRVGSKEEPSPDRQEIFAEDFERYATAEEVESLGGWEIVNGAGVPEVRWRLWNTAGEPLNSEDPNLVGMSGNYMISDSDLEKSARLDEHLISPIVDCAGHRGVWLQFNSNIRVYGEESEPDRQVTELDVSVYDTDSGEWSEWRNVFSRDRTSGDWSSGTPRVFSLSPFADGKRVKVRWRFYDAQFDYWWAIDNVRVTGELVQE